MAAGGFKFGQASATYDSASYTTKRAWALAVHRARCDAFFLAQYREGGNWETVETEELNEFSDSRTVDGHTYTLYIQDIHPTSSDTTESYPAFVSFWRISDSATEYAIITSHGMHWEPSYSSNISYGMYIHGNHLPNTGSSTSYRYTFLSLAHSWATAGFADYDFSTSDVNGQQLPICSIFGTYSSKRTSTSSTVNTTGSVVYSPTQGVTYYFGYAIRDRVIECFFRTSQYDANSGWNWSIIGRFLDNPVSGYPNAYYSYCNNGSETTKVDTSFYPTYSRVSTPFACTDYHEGTFPPTYISTCDRQPCLRPSFIPSRCNSNVPSELLFSAGCLSFCQTSGTLYTENYEGLDGNGNCVAGLINTDVLRIVPRQACNVGGAVYQGGNFVVPTRQISIDNCDDFGVLLGWDPSNESIV